MGIEPSGAENDLRPQSVTSITGRSRPGSSVAPGGSRPGTSGSLSGANEGEPGAA